MFIIDESLKLTFVCSNFINTHSLPSMKALQGTSIITLLAFIMSPRTKSDHDVLLEAKTKLLSLRISENITYNLPIANKLYELSFRKLSDQESIGKMKQLETPLTFPNENEEVGNQLTTLIFEARPLLEDSDNKAIGSKFNSSPIIPSLSVSSKPHNRGLPQILVVDDSEVNRQVADIFLTPKFPTPIYAKNGLEALDVLKREHVDLVLMDIHMPEMNGVETTLAIRKANAPWSNIIIIALTADTKYQNRHVYENVGMDDAICKPLRQDILVKTILTNWNSFKLNQEIRPKKLNHAS